MPAMEPPKPSNAFASRDGAASAGSDFEAFFGNEPNPSLLDARIPGRTPDLSGLAMYVDDDSLRADAAIGAGHASHEIKLEFGEGTITGGVVLTLEAGPTGIPLKDSGLRLFETTASTKVNGLVHRLETSLMNGEFDAEIFEGFDIAFETNIATLGIEGDEVEADLLAFSVKVVGDATKLVGAPKGTTVTLDGRLTFSLGGKLAAKLASFAAAQAEKKALAKQMAELGADMEGQATKVKAMRKELEALEAAGRKLYPDAATLRREIAQHEAQLLSKASKLKGLGQKLGSAGRKAAEAISKVRGKVAKKIAQAMEKKVVMQVASKLAKLVPVLNIVSTVIDVMELMNVLFRLLDGDYGGSGEESEQTKGKAGEEPASSEGSPTGTVPHADAMEVSPSAKAVLDAVTRKGGGLQLDDDQRKMVELLVPPDLTPEELAAVLAQLRTTGVKAQSAEDAIAAIDHAVRSVRAKKQTMKVNGKPMPVGDTVSDEESAHGEESKQTDVSSDRPVTSPSQVATPFDVVDGGAPDIVKSWFELRGNALVASAAGRKWWSDHRNTMLSPTTRLVSIAPSIDQTKAGEWNISITFQMEEGERSKRTIHRYFVTKLDKNEFALMPYQLIEV